MDNLTPKTRRGLGIAVILAILGLASWLVLMALNDHVVFFFGPGDIKDQTRGGSVVRLGGLVDEGSVKDATKGVEFRVTDGESSIEVTYEGILPDLFREGQGVVVEGTLDGQIFIASRVLAKHDETYMPPEVADLLKKQGVWRGDNSE